MNRIVEDMPAPNTKTYEGINPANDDLVERKVTDPFSGQIWKTMVDPFVGRMSYIRIFSGDMKADATYQLIGDGTEGQERISGLFTMQGKKQINLDVAHAGDIVVTSKLANAGTCDTLCEKSSQIKYDRIEFPEPMLAMAVSSVKKGEEDKVIGAIRRQQDEDKTIKLVKDKATKQTILSGIGEVHLDILGDKIQRKFGVQMVLGEPKVDYRFKASIKSNPAVTVNTATFGLKSARRKIQIRTSATEMFSRLTKFSAAAFRVISSPQSRKALLKLWLKA